MIKIEHWEVVGWEHTIRGMRNPMNSWEKSDSLFFDYGTYDDKLICHNCTGKEVQISPEEWATDVENDYLIGEKDLNLMKHLAFCGSDHAKYRRMIIVYADITAPLYWWKEFDTYKVGTVANSCSTMHKITDRPLRLDDFSHEHLYNDEREVLKEVIRTINGARELYLNEHFDENKKKDWWQMIQLLPSSYNQKRTVMLNYEVLANIYPARKNHKLDEWRAFCDWIKDLPYNSEVITVESNSAVS